jgi:bifunctional enzyme CysN/CysC
MPSPRVTWNAGSVTRVDRARLLGGGGATIWFTGLPGSGKSTLAAAVERELVLAGRAAYRLDGDNLRTGLNGDLAFGRADREENVRRVAEVACLFADAGLVALAALISPHAGARRAARALHETAGLPFVEVYLDTPVALCEERDTKGLYAEARAGRLRSFTGVDDPYDVPERPDVVVRPETGPDAAVAQVVSALEHCSPGTGRCVGRG